MMVEAPRVDVPSRGKGRCGREKMLVASTCWLSFVSQEDGRGRGEKETPFEGSRKPPQRRLATHHEPCAWW